jgi:hypothetical protein
MRGRRILDISEVNAKSDWTGTLARTRFSKTRWMIGRKRSGCRAIAAGCP